MATRASAWQAAVVEDTVFYVANGVVAPVWLLMLVAPRWRVTEVLVRGLWAPLVVASIYLVLVLTHMGATGGDFWSLDGVARLFESRAVLLAGWIHYLCFDLVVGSWELRDAQLHGVRHGWLAPCLILTLMWGPIGLIAYRALRWVGRREASVLP